MNRLLLALLLALCLLLLTGCRTRMTSAARLLGESARSSGAQVGSGSSNSEGAESEAFSEIRLVDVAAQTIENPKAARREYDDNASAEVALGANHRIQADGEGEGAPLDSKEGPGMDQFREGSERTATQTIPASEADRIGTNENADAADTYLLYYTALLQERMNSLFECQRKDLYLETPEAFRTIHKTSPEHQLILSAGCYDVSSRLLEENLTVDAGWVQRKNPGVIVKLVDSSVLGFGVTDSAAAKGVFDAITSRPDWAGIDAVRNGRVLLVSEQLLTSQTLRTAAIVAIAKIAAPELFADTDLDEAMRHLTQEASGSPAEGLLIYQKE